MSRAAPSQSLDEVRPDAVRDALAHLYDLAHLQTHALTLNLPGGGGSIGAARALQADLLAAVDALRQAGHRGRDQHAERGYRILRGQFVDGETTAAVAAQLAIGKSEYHRDQRHAIAAVAAILAERWGGKRAASPAPGPGQAPREVQGLPDIPPTSFMGRELEVEELLAALDRARLLTLTGPAGVGKTRLAVELVHRVAQANAASFPDGIWWVDLSAASTAEQAAQAIRAALGLVLAPEARAGDALRAFLTPRRCLLVVDNVEQVVDGGPLVAALVARCPGLTIVATSRARLNVRGEVRWEVSTLATPSPDAPVALVCDAPAVRLFLDRLRTARPAVLAEDELSAIAELCRRVDGLPLAIELAAARGHVLPPSAMVARFARDGLDLGLLAGGPRDLPPRQQSLRAALAWSHDLLSESARALFRRLAVFAGPVDADAVAAMIDRSAEEALSSLAELVDAALVAPAGAVAEEPRFRLLQPMRAYAAEQLDAAEERAATLERHARVFDRRARQVEATLCGPFFVWRADLAECLQAIDWFRRRNEPAGAARIALVLVSVVRSIAHRHQLLPVFEWLAERSDTIADERLRRRVQLFALTVAGIEGPLGFQRDALERGLAEARSVDDRPAVAEALHALGRAGVNGGDQMRDVVPPLAEEAMRIWLDLENLVSAAFAASLNGLARGAPSEPGERWLREALALAEAAGAGHAAAECRWSLGLGYLRLGDMAGAEAMAQHLLADVGSADARSDAMLPRDLAARGHELLAWVRLEAGDLARATGHLRAGLGLRRGTGEVIMTAGMLTLAGGLAAACDQPHRACDYVGAARAARQSPAWYVARSDQWVAPARAALGDEEIRAALADGAARPLDEAVGDALAWLSTLEQGAR